MAHLLGVVPNASYEVSRNSSPILNWTEQETYEQVVYVQSLRRTNLLQMLRPAPVDDVLSSGEWREFGSIDPTLTVV